MSWDYAIKYMEKQRFIRGEEVTTGATSMVKMHANPEARPEGGSDQEIVLEVICDGDGRPMSAQLRTI